MTPKKELSMEMYAVGLIAALPKELAAARAVLDEEHKTPSDFKRHPNDNNHYSWGLIGAHHVVIAPLPSGIYGTVSASTTASQFLSSLPHIRFGLMVGIGAGIPRDDFDIRLGDVIVSRPEGASPGVVQYDFGKIQKDGLFHRVGCLASPPDFLLTALAKLESEHLLRGSQLPDILREMLERYPALAKPTNNGIASVYQGIHNDRLFLASTTHIDIDSVQHTGSLSRNIWPVLHLTLVWVRWLLWFLIVSPSKLLSTNTPRSYASCEEADIQEMMQHEVCTSCDPSKEIKRQPRDSTDPLIHYGLIASGNLLVKDGVSRDKILQGIDSKCICFEMEAAGLMRTLPCLVIRGVCDYADTHKNDRWQNYAAAVAAAFAKELLREIDELDVWRAPKIKEMMDKLIHDVSDMAKSTAENTREMQLIRESRLSQKMIDWLNPVDMFQAQENALKQRHAGTGTWLLGHELYSQWKQSDKSSFCLFGKPGSGKTILSSTIIQDLGGSDMDCRHVLYFYFAFADVRRQSLQGAIRSLIHQLSCESDAARDFFISFYSGYERTSKQPDTSALCEVFEQMVQRTGNIWLVFDALDECQTDDRTSNTAVFLSWIKSLVESQISIHVILTSRPDPSIQMLLKTWADHQITLDTSLITQDIEDFVHDIVTKDESLAIWRSSQDIQEDIKRHLMAQADGMFLWVSCQIKALRDCIQPSTLRKTLESLPRTLEETYEEALKRIPKIEHEIIMRLLQFLAVSERPLRIEEAVDILAVDFADYPRFNTLNRTPVPEYIYRYCAGLIFVESVGSDKRKGRMQLAHSTVKEFLLSHQTQKAVFSCLASPLPSVAIAEVCIAYLLEVKNSCSFRGMNAPFTRMKFKWGWMTGSNTAKVVAAIEAEYPLAQYAAQNCMKHAVPAETNVIQALFQELLDCKESCAIFCHLRRMDKDREYVAHYLDSEHEDYKSEREEFDATFHAPTQDLRHLSGYNTEEQGYMLYVLALEGLDWAVEMFLRKEPAVVDHAENHLENALTAAAKSGHAPTVKILLEKGARVNRISLRNATRTGSLSVVNILLGAVDNAQAGDCCLMALQHASELGQLEIARLLLDKGSKIDALPVASASKHGFTKLVGLLLENLDDSAADRCCGQGLVEASANGHLGIVKMLLDKGTNVNNKGYMSCLTPICRAAQNGHEDIVNLLLERGAGTIKTSPDDDVVCIAFERGHRRVVQALLDKLPDDSSYEWALVNACAAGHHQLMEMIFDKVTNRDVYGQGLVVASANGHFEVVKTLIDVKGADVNISLSFDIGRNPLCKAISSNHTEVAKLLLERGADVLARTNFSGSDALETATSLGNEELVSIILDTGVDLNNRGGNEGNALHIACRKGQENIVRMLLDKGADVNVGCRSYGTAFECASRTKQDKIIDILAERGDERSIRYQMRRRRVERDLAIAGS